MNVRTVAELCKIDLLRLIETGDFRKMAAAESVIDTHLSSLRSERDQNALLYHVGDELAFVDVSDRPEADACLRAAKAMIRRRVQAKFEARSIGAGAHERAPGSACRLRLKAI